MERRRVGLTLSIVTTLALILLAGWLLMSITAFGTAERDLRARTVEEARLLVQTISLLLPRPVREPDSTLLLRGLASRQGTGTGIVDILLFRGGDDGGSTGGETWRFSPDGRVLHFSRGIGEGWGVQLSLSLDRELSRIHRSRALSVAYFVLDFVLLLFVGSWLVARVAIFPLKRLVDATERVADGDLDHDVPASGSREFAELADSFNRMTASLRRQRKEIESHVRELERVNRELKDARDETLRSEKLASIGILAAGMAHEIGTPLSTILGFAEMLQEDLSHDPAAREMLERIVSEGKRIDRLVRELLDFARPSPVVEEEIDLCGLLDGLLSMLQRQGVLKGIGWRREDDGSMPRVMGDRDQLTQLFLNILLNARDAMPHGGELTVRVATPPLQEGEGEGTPLAEIAVADTGVGIPPDLLPRIFDPFVTSKGGRGTGLGLSIVARIVDSLGGRVEVESREGEGTRFTVRIPAVRQREEERR